MASSDGVSLDQVAGPPPMGQSETGLQTTSIRFPAAVAEGWQAIFDPMQWILQHWRGSSWRNTAYCVTRAGLEQNIRERVGRKYQGAVAHFPDWHPDRRAQL